MDSAFDDPFFSGGMLGGGMMGGGLMRSMMEDFGSMHGMMENRSEGMERFGTDTGMGGLGGMMRQMGTMAQHGGGSNSFSTQSFCMSSSSNGDGPPKVQRFSQSTVGGRHNGKIISETQQSYSDSHTGTQKAALERAKGNRARKIVKERVHGRETTRDMLKNIREDETSRFDSEWNTAASQSGISNTRMRNMLGGPQPQHSQHKQLRNTSHEPRGRFDAAGRTGGYNLPYDASAGAAAPVHGGLGSGTRSNSITSNRSVASNGSSRSNRSIASNGSSRRNRSIASNMG